MPPAPAMATVISSAHGSVLIRPATRRATWAASEKASASSATAAVTASCATLITPDPIATISESRVPAPPPVSGAADHQIVPAASKAAVVMPRSEIRLLLRPCAARSCPRGVIGVPP